MFIRECSIYVSINQDKKERISSLQERDKCSSRKHLHETVEELRRFNSKRKLKVRIFDCCKLLLLNLSSKYCITSTSLTLTLHSFSQMCCRRRTAARGVRRVCSRHLPVASWTISTWTATCPLPRPPATISSDAPPSTLLIQPARRPSLKSPNCSTPGWNRYDDSTLLFTWNVTNSPSS